MIDRLMIAGRAMHCLNPAKHACACAMVAQITDAKSNNNCIVIVVVEVVALAGWQCGWQLTPAKW